MKILNIEYKNKEHASLYIKLIKNFFHRNCILCLEADEVVNPILKEIIEDNMLIESKYPVVNSIFKVLYIHELYAHNKNMKNTVLIIHNYYSIFGAKDSDIKYLYALNSPTIHPDINVIIDNNSSNYYTSESDFYNIRDINHLEQDIIKIIDERWAIDVNCN